MILWLWKNQNKTRIFESLASIAHISDRCWDLQRSLISFHFGLKNKPTCASVSTGQGNKGNDLNIGTLLEERPLASEQTPGLHNQANYHRAYRSKATTANTTIIVDYKQTRQICNMPASLSDTPIPWIFAVLFPGASMINRGCYEADTPMNRDHKTLSPGHFPDQCPTQKKCKFHVFNKADETKKQWWANQACFLFTLPSHLAAARCKPSDSCQLTWDALKDSNKLGDLQRAHD